MTRRFFAQNRWLLSNILLGVIAALLLLAIALIASFNGGVAIELGGLEMSLNAQKDGQLQLLFAQAI